MKCRTFTLVWLLGALVGCQHYTRVRLDTDRHGEAWATRAPDHAAINTFLKKLNELNADAVIEFNLSDGLSLSEAEVVSLVFNPTLRVARLKARVPLVGAKEAGRWEDPELDFDLLRVTDSVKDPWIVGSSLSFTIPISGRLEVEKEKAFSEAGVERRNAHLAEWMLLSDLRAAWAEWTGTTQLIELTEAYLKDLEGVLDLAEKQRKASRIGAPDLRILQLENVTRIGQLNALRNKQHQQELGIKSLLGLTPDSELNLRPSLPTGLAATDPGQRRQQLRDHNLQLAVAKAEFEVSDHKFRLEIRKQYPDLVIGPGYENEDGMSKAGVVLSIPIPLLNRNRRAIAEARAAREAAKAAYESEFESLVAELAQAEARVTGARSQSGYLLKKVVPMVDQQMKDLRRLAGLGDLDVLVILDALTRTLETKEQVLESKVEEALAVESLRSLLRPLNTPQSHVTTDDKE